MEPEKRPQKRAEDPISLLVPDWSPTPRQVLWTIRIAIVLGIIIAIGYAFDITLWDWLKLLVVPAVIAGGGIWFNRQQQERDLETAEKRGQDEALQAYLDQMSSLLLPAPDQPSLYKAQPGDGLSSVARARTLTSLSRLGGSHRGRVVQFLYESGLITKEHPIVVLETADLREANLKDARLGYAELSFVDLRGADLRRAYLGGAELQETDLRQVLSDGGTFLGSANLSGAKMKGMNLSGANVNQAVLSGADLNKANLGTTYLYSARLVGANLKEANLREAKLSGTNLTKADLTKADLSGAKLGRYKNRLKGADLSEADLSGADLTGADLSGADLTGARGVAYEQLDKASSLSGATMPNGQKYEDWLKDREGRGEEEDNSGFS